MKTIIFINRSTCTKCMLCTEVCPNKILLKNESNIITFDPEKVSLCFICGQCMAVCPAKSILVDGLSYEKDFFELPAYEPGGLESPFFDLIRTRRAIRNFQDKPVPQELLKKIVESIMLAPPGFPPVKTRIIVVQNSAVIRQSLPYMIRLYQKLLRRLKNPFIHYFIRQKVGVRRFRTMREHLVPLLKSRLPALKAGTEDTLTRNAPAMILFLADRNGEDISQDISIAATYGMLASHALGLGGSIMDIIPPAINKDKNLRRMFEIPHSQEVISSLIIGFPKYKYQRGIRRSLRSVRWL
ncbi:nitroreductase family protein [Microbacter margulisiae]|uniref:Nitroreductase/NAD-dependent dihydropyrimidine dehydrogenase PreA subunit n=1 Tax=Microbacter margulisiae TaxID=1350067 RepID=A0A7W5DRR8_9PORP|nr:nitroreductase family protein [Microbacter margulisiae]MBB3187904.1 nitroreductase/NAD-dependent dihydropyrimidine dehydrogenase PreA subunit [Microbacter margulisiae]